MRESHQNHFRAKQKYGPSRNRASIHAKPATAEQQHPQPAPKLEEKKQQKEELKRDEKPPQ